MTLVSRRGFCSSIDFSESSSSYWSKLYNVIIWNDFQMKLVNLWLFNVLWYEIM